MSIESHITELRRKHDALSDMVVKAQRSPAKDDSEISALKRQKLKIKEEITRLSQAH